MLSRLVPAAVAEPSTTPRTNWAGNYTFQAEHLYEPTTVEEVQHLVRTCSKLRALGRGHSFNGIADSTTNQVTLKNLQSIELDASDWTVKVGSGISYGQLAPVIDAKGWAVHNLALAAPCLGRWRLRDRDPRLGSQEWLPVDLHVGH